MNPRRRRGVLLLAVAAVGALVVFASVSAYVADVNAKVGPTGPVLRLRQDAPAFGPVTPEMVERVEVPERWVPATAIRGEREIVGLVAGTDLPRGSILQAGMLVPAPRLAPGQREIAILVDAETGVAGKIGPDSVVDIYATFDDDAGTSRSQVIVTRARIIDVGVPESVSGVTETGGFGEGRVVPVTFALSVQDALVLTYAESFATKVRLALVGGGDLSTPAPDQRSFDLSQLDRLTGVPPVEGS